MPNRTDTLISTALGKMKSVKARLEGLTGVFRTLAEQHGEVTALLERVRSSASKRADLWPTIRRELLSHERAEMREVYPVLRQYAEVRALADHHDEEARDLEQMIERIDATLMQSAAWGQQFKQLVDMVLRHATDEEQRIFPAAQKAIGKTRAQELDATFVQTKQQLAEIV